MELDALKNDWANMNSQPTAQQHLSTKTIDQITRTKYSSRMKRIALPELAGMAVCIAAIIYIGMNFYRLDTAFMKGAGIVAQLTLVALCFISVLSLRQVNITREVSKPYAETLKAFAVGKLRFYRYQKINMVLSYLLLVTVIFILSKIVGGKDLSHNNYFRLMGFSVGYIFLSFFSRWVFKKYKRTLQQAEELLKEVG